MSTYGERLREARQAAGMTQKALAAKTGLSQTTISDGERGRNTGSSATALLALALGVEPLWLSENRGQKRRPTDDQLAGSAKETESSSTADAQEQSDEITIPEAQPKPTTSPDRNEALLVAAYRAASADARGLLLAAAKAAMTQHPRALAEDQRHGYQITRNTSDSSTTTASQTPKKIRYKK